MYDEKEFIEAARELVQISDDSWKLVKHNFSEYLVTSQKFICDEKFRKLKKNSNENLDGIVSTDPSVKYEIQETIQIEYHVVYSVSYQVPVMYFNCYRNDGTIIALEEAWEIFTEFHKHDKMDMLSILTQTDHPVLFKPFLTLHPCRTAEILSNTPKSKNFIVTFLSIIGPYIKLQLIPQIKLHYDKDIYDNDSIKL